VSHQQQRVEGSKIEEEEREDLKDHCSSMEEVSHRAKEGSLRSLVEVEGEHRPRDRCMTWEVEREEVRVDCKLREEAVGEYRKKLEGRHREVLHLHRKREWERHKEKRQREGDQIPRGMQMGKLSIDE